MPCNGQISRSTNGFTLIELIIGIVVLAISFSVITRFVMPTTVQSANQLHQIRAAELAQSMMNEIVGKSFDHHSDHVGGVNRCDQTTCTSPANLGPEEASRELYNDVDDYICLNIDAACADVSNSKGESLAADLYRGYRVTVDVHYDGGYNGNNDTAITLAKRIDLAVHLPDNEVLHFATYKANF
ncbi:type IV pilus modification PilV family protein [Colwellia sp. MEBiC06753]